MDNGAVGRPPLLRLAGQRPGLDPQRQTDSTQGRQDPTAGNGGGDGRMIMPMGPTDKDAIPKLIDIMRTACIIISGGRSCES